MTSDFTVLPYSCARFAAPSNGVAMDGAAGGCTGQQRPEPCHSSFKGNCP